MPLVISTTSPILWLNRGTNFFENHIDKIRDVPRVVVHRDSGHRANLGLGADNTVQDSKDFGVHDTRLTVNAQLSQSRVKYHLLRSPTIGLIHYYTADSVGNQVSKSIILGDNLNYMVVLVFDMYICFFGSNLPRIRASLQRTKRRLDSPRAATGQWQWCWCTRLEEILSAKGGLHSSISTKETGSETVRIELEENNKRRSKDVGQSDAF
ncbi:hypothetical protein DFH09DRAFT_1405719 [Mycena vulgaris]|nr:hypothetical protein DFH09DRAFT_1405719 [Mycena vulgaris]